MLTHLINGSELSIRNAASGDTFRTLRPNDGVVQRAEISPDGQWIAMQGHADSTLISLWDADRGEVDTMLRGHRAVVNDIAFSPDAKRIATASSDRTVRLWYVANGRDRATYPTRTWFNDPLAIASPDGEQLAVVARDTATAGLLVRIDQPDQTVEVSARVQLRNGTSTRFVASENQRLAIHSIADGKELDSISSPNGSIRTAAINLDGDRVAAATGGNTLLLWFPDEHRQIQLTNRSAPIFALQFNPAGDQLASASADGFVNVWNADTGALLAALQSDAIVLDVDYHPQATQLIAVTDQDRAVLWDLTTFQELRSLKAAGSRFNQVRFSFDGKHVVSYRSSDSAAVHLWDVATGNLVSKLDVTGRVHVAMHPASHEALVTSSDQGAMIWQYDRNLRQPVTDAPMICGQFSVDGSEFVVGSSVPLPDQPWQLTEAPGDFAPSVLQRWRREGLAQVQSIELPSESLFELFLSRDGVALVNCGRHAEVINFDAVTHEQICRIPGHAAQISACLFTSDSSRLITAAWDQKISIWDAGNGRLLKTLVAHQSAINCLAIGHDDRSLLSGAEDGRCILWNLQSGQPEQQFQLAESAIRFVAFHPAGDQFLAVTSDHALHLHDVPAGREIDLDVGVSKISWAEYSPDGATLLVVPHESANTVPDDPAQPQPGERADQRVLIVPLNGSAITSVVHDAPVVTAHFHPAGGQFLSAMQSGTVTLRDASSGRIRWQPPDRGAIVTAAVMSGSGKYAAVAGHDRVNVWRVEDNLLWLTLPTMVRFPTPVHRFNPFVPNASIVLTQRMDSLEFRSWPLEPVEFAESQSLRPLTPQEKAEFLLD
jgi:WD40 repeat protein